MKNRKKKLFVAQKPVNDEINKHRYDPDFFSRKLKFVSSSRQNKIENTNRNMIGSRHDFDVISQKR